MDKRLILNRIKEFKNFKTDLELANFLQISKSTLSNWYSRNSIDFDLLFSKCELDIDLNWLITGRAILPNIDKPNIINESSEMYNVRSIPLVSVNAVGGFGNNSFAIEERDVKDYYVIPKFRHKKVDFMIEVEGSSMYPKYNSGDVVACTIINENSFIQWNKTHVVATKEQGIIIKRIKKGDDDANLCMVSDNKDYDAFEVPKSEITGIALVVGVIRLE